MRTKTLLSTAALLGIAVAAGGCTSTPTRTGSHADMQEAVAEITDRLIQSAELRTDMRNVRVCVHEIGADPMEARTKAFRSLNAPSQDWVSLELQKEVVVAIANRLNVVETELGNANAPDLRRTALHDAADHFGASHFLIGDYVMNGAEVMLSLRLVDAESSLIVSAARGPVRVPGLRGRGRSLGLSAAAAGTPALSSSVQPKASGTPSLDGSYVLAQSDPEDFERWLARQQAKQAARSEDFETWLARQRAKPAVSSEDFETWLAREQAKQAAEQAADLAQQSTPGSKPSAPLAGSATPPGATALDPTGRMPWRTPSLAQLLGIKIEEGPVVPQAGGEAQASGDDDPR